MFKRVTCWRYQPSGGAPRGPLPKTPRSYRPPLPITRLRRLRLGIILASGTRYRLCSIGLVPSAKRIQGEILSCLRLSLSFDQEISLCLFAHPLQSLTDYEH